LSPIIEDSSDLKTIDRSVDRSACAAEEKTPDDTTKLAADIFARTYSGLSTEARDAEWTESWQWYESLARDVIAGRVPRDVLAACMNAARRDKTNRGRKLNGLIGRFLRGEGAPPLPPPPKTAPPGPATLPFHVPAPAVLPEPPIDPAETRAQAVKLAAGHGPWATYWQKWLKDNPEESAP